MTLLANHYEEGVVVRARPPHPYDTRWRIIGRVMLREDAVHGFFDGEVEQGATRVEIDSRWVVDASAPAPAWPRSPVLDAEPPEPDWLDVDGHPHIVPSPRYA